METTKSIDLAAVLLKSPGGKLVEGLKIGRAIHTAGFTTGVAPLTACASACALAWLGGSVRYMAPTALVGFHAEYVIEDGSTKESGVGNAQVGAYLNEIGLGFDAVVFVSSASPNEMNWLNASKAKQSGIDVVILSDEGSQVQIEKNIELKLPSGFRWIVIESAASPTQLKTAKIADQLVKTQNGYFAAVLGPYERSVANEIISGNKDLPKDSYLSSGNGFLFSIPK